MIVTCDVCREDALSAHHMTGEEFTAMLRFEGWKLWVGNSLTGKDITVQICPTCSEASPRPRPAKVLPGQEGFDFG